MDTIKSCGYCHEPFEVESKPGRPPRYCLAHRSWTKRNPEQNRARARARARQHYAVHAEEIKYRVRHRQGHTPRPAETGDKLTLRCPRCKKYFDTVVKSAGQIKTYCDKCVSWHRLHPDRATAKSERWNVKNPNARRARNALWYALQEGQVEKPVMCPRCGKNKMICGYHYLGYDPEHWLDVEWSCKKCYAGKNKIHP